MVRVLRYAMARGNSVKYIITLIVTLAVAAGFALKTLTSSRGPEKPRPFEKGAAHQPIHATQKADSGADEPLPQPRRRVERPRPEGKFREQILVAEKLLDQGDIKGAVEALENILKQDPNQERALEMLGMIYMTDLQDPEKAVGYFKQILSANPNNDFAVMELVGASTDPSRAQPMLNYLQSLYQAHPSSVVLADGIGELLMSQGRIEEALPLLERSAGDPKFAEFSYSRMAAIYERTGQADKAADSYRKSISAQSDEIQRRKSEGQSTDIVEFSMARTQLDLAQLMMRQRKYREAEDLIEKARRVMGNDWEIENMQHRLRQLEASSP